MLQWMNSYDWIFDSSPSVIVEFSIELSELSLKLSVDKDLPRAS